MAYVNFVILSLFACIICSVVRCEPLNLNGPNLEAGKLESDHKLLYSIVTAVDPISDADVTYRDIVVSSGDIQITYLKAIEQGKYPDAGSSIPDGGPGGDFVKIRLIPGDLGGFNYTVQIFVAKIPRNFEKAYHKYEITFYN